MRFTGIASLAATTTAMLALAPAAPAADGGPSQNIPIPASARQQTAPTATATSPAATQALPTAAATAPTGATTAPASPATGATPATPTTTAPGANRFQPLGALRRGQANAKRAKQGGGISDEAIVLAAVAALIALACAAWGLARMRAYEPRWVLSLRHSLAEAEQRASATWAELGDWVRLGR